MNWTGIITSLPKLLHPRRKPHMHRHGLDEQQLPCV